MRPTRVGTPGIIGGAYKCLVSRFAATAGNKAVEFYTLANVSMLVARFVELQESNGFCYPTCKSGA